MQLLCYQGRAPTGMPGGWPQPVFLDRGPQASANDPATPAMQSGDVQSEQTRCSHFSAALSIEGGCSQMSMTAQSGCCQLLLTKTTVGLQKEVLRGSV